MEFLLIDICKGKPSEVSDEDEKLVDIIENWFMETIPNSFKHSPYRGARLITVPEANSFNTMIKLAQIIPGLPQVEFTFYCPKIVCGLMQYSNK